MKILLEEDSDEFFEFLNRYSSRTFTDIENEEEDDHQDADHGAVHFPKLPTTG